MKKQLVKSEQNKVFSGALAGLGNYLNVDPNIVRLAYVALVLLTGQWLLGVLVYGVFAVILPHENYNQW